MIRIPLIAAAMPAAAFLATWSTSTPRNATPPRETVRIHTNLPRISHEQLVRSSSHAVLGTVRSVTPFEFQPGWISRRVELVVDDCWRGEAGQTCTLLVHGGSLGHRVTYDATAPDLRVGERWLFYGQSVPEQTAIVLSAGCQGAARVRRELTTDVVELHGESMPVAGLRLRDQELAARDAAQPSAQGGGR